MAESEYLTVEEEALPTSESIQAAEEEGGAETRPCMDCGEAVSVGERVAVLTEDGEAWRHPWH